MKRLDLVQLTIIIVGIISAYFAIVTAPQFITLLFLWFEKDLSGGYAMMSFIQAILLLATYLLLSIYAIKNSKQLAETLANKANLQSNINFALNKKELLYAVFIGLGIYGLIENLPFFLKDIFMYIQENKRPLQLFEEPQSVTKSSLFVQVFKIGLYFVLVYYANVFAEFLAAKIKNTEPVDEINSHNES